MHDQMMLALERWAADPANVRALLALPNAFHERRDTVTHSLAPGSLDAWAVDRHRETVAYRFRERFADRSKPAQIEWPDAPAPVWRMPEPPQWKPSPPRSHFGRRKAPGAFCDMKITYDVDWVLDRCQVQWHHAVKVDISGREWDVQYQFEATGEQTHDWRQHGRTVCIYFVALPNVASLGELMARLQTCKALLPPLDRDDSTGERVSLAIYAPSHADAARLCRQHGVHYLEYRPAADRQGATLP